VLNLFTTVLISTTMIIVQFQGICDLAVFLRKHSLILLMACSSITLFGSM